MYKIIQKIIKNSWFFGIFCKIILSIVTFSHRDKKLISPPKDNKITSSLNAKVATLLGLNESVKKNKQNNCDTTFKSTHKQKLSISWTLTTLAQIFGTCKNNKNKNLNLILKSLQTRKSEMNSIMNKLKIILIFSMALL